MRKIWGAACCLLLLCQVLSGGENLLRNGDFSQGLQGWAKSSKAGSCRADKKTFVSHPVSLRVESDKGWVSIEQRVRLETGARYVLSFYLKGSGLTRRQKFSGASVTVAGGDKSLSYGPQGLWKYGNGTFDWTRAEHEFDADHFPSPEVRIRMDIANSVGTAYFDDLRLEKVQAQSETPGAGLGSQLFPPCFMKGDPFTICENFPAALVFGGFAISEEVRQSLAGQGGVLTLEVPVFLRLGGACASFPLRNDGVRRYTAHPVAESRSEREGRQYRKYTIDLGRECSSFIGVGKPSGWYLEKLFLVAEKGSKRSSGNMYWHLEIGGRSAPEGNYAVQVLPPLEPPARKASLFKLAVADISAATSPFTDLAGRSLDFWQSLHERPILLRHGLGRALPPEIEERLLKDFDTHIIVFTGKETLFFTHFDESFKVYTEAIRQGKYPALVNDKGKKLTESFPAWYLVEDPDGVYDKFLREGFATVKKSCPGAKAFVWDYEPHPYGYCEEGRRRFAKHMKLDRVPGINEIKIRYSRQWLAYMAGLHARLITKTVRVFRDVWPETEVWLCSDNLHAAEPHVAEWCAVDVSLADDAVDGHMPMPYYSGTRYFDDIAYNLARLQKPVLALNDPAEFSRSFFDQYTPDKLRQNIIATAALGAAGFGLWPDDTLSGRYLENIRSAYADIASTEAFYLHGRRADSEFEISAQNVAVKELKDKNGRAVRVTSPDFSHSLKALAHARDDEWLVTVFNYNKKEPVVVRVVQKRAGAETLTVGEVNGPRYTRGGRNPDAAEREKGFLVRVEPNGVKLIRIGHGTHSGELAQETLARKLAKQLAQLNAVKRFREIRSGKNSAVWGLLDGRPALLLDNGTATAVLDTSGCGEVIGFYPSCKRNQDCLYHKSRGFLGRLTFFRTDRAYSPDGFILDDIAVRNGVPCAMLRQRIPRLAGADPEDNPLCGLEIVKTYALRPGSEGLDIAIAFANHAQRPMSFGFRAGNLPLPGSRLAGAKALAEISTVSLASNGKTAALTADSPVDNLFVKKNAAVDFLQNTSRRPWDGGSVTLRAGADHLAETLSFNPSENFCGVYCWKGEVLTVEFLCGKVTLGPGEKTEFSYSVARQH